MKPQTSQATHEQTQRFLSNAEVITTEARRVTVYNATVKGQAAAVVNRPNLFRTLKSAVSEATNVAPVSETRTKLTESLRVVGQMNEQEQLAVAQEQMGIEAQALIDEIHGNSHEYSLSA